MRSAPGQRAGLAPVPPLLLRTLYRCSSSTGTCTTATARRTSFGAGRGVAAVSLRRPPPPFPPPRPLLLLLCLGGLLALLATSTPGPACRALPLASTHGHCCRRHRCRRCCAMQGGPVSAPHRPAPAGRVARQRRPARDGRRWVGGSAGWACGRVAAPACLPGSCQPPPSHAQMNGRICAPRRGRPCRRGHGQHPKSAAPGAQRARGGAAGLGRGGGARSPSLWARPDRRQRGWVGGWMGGWLGWAGGWHGWSAMGMRSTRVWRPCLPGRPACRSTPPHSHISPSATPGCDARYEDPLEHLQLQPRAC